MKTEKIVVLHKHSIPEEVLDYLDGIQDLSSELGEVCLFYRETIENQVLYGYLEESLEKQIKNFLKEIGSKTKFILILD